MHMDPTAGIRQGSCLPQLPHQFLYGLDILITADGAHHLGFIAVTGCHAALSLFSLRFYAGVTHEFPFPALGIQRNIGVVISSFIVGLGAKIGSCNLRPTFPGDPRQLNLNPKPLLFHVHGTTSRLIVRLPFQTALPYNPAPSPLGCNAHSRIYRDTHRAGDSGSG